MIQVNFVQRSCWAVATPESEDETIEKESLVETATYDDGDKRETRIVAVW